MSLRRYFGSRACFLAAVLMFGASLPATVAQMLVVNGDFESGTLVPWKIVHAGGEVSELPQARVEESAAQEGKFGLRVLPPSGKTSVYSVSQEVRFVDAAHFSKGLHVRFAGRVTRPDATSTAVRNAHFGISFSCLFEDGTALWDTRARQALLDPTKEGWQVVEFDWFPQKGLSKLILRLGVSSAVGEVCYDSVSLTPL